MERGGLNNDSINRKTGKAIGFNVGEYYHDASGKKIRYIGNDLFMDDKRNYIKVDLDTVKLANGGEIDWGSDLGDGFTIGTDVHITDNKSLYNGKTGYVSGVVGKNLMVTILENDNERNVVVSKKGVEKLDAPEFGRGGVISSSTTKEGIEKLIGDYYYSKNISLRKLDDKDEYEVYNSKGKINGVKVVLNKGRYQFVESNKMAHGGYMEEGGEIKEVTDGEDTFYLTYIDPTHFYTSNSKDFIGNAHHLAEFRSRPFYNEVKSWLNSYNATKVAKDTSSKKDEFENLKQKYTDERQSLDEFFTPKWVAEIMYKLAVKYGFKGGNVLEPSFGKGVFFDVLIEHGIKPNQLWGCEIYKPNFDYVERTYPSAHLIKHNFEYEFAPSEVALNRDGIFLNKEFKETTFDLVIGNPPYGSHKSPYSYFWADDLQVRYEGFFIYLALQKLKKDGLCVFIINSLWLNNGNKYNKQKEMIDKYGEMIDSYRLPNNIFKGENRDTSIATDIVIFKRK
jgi:type I restriction-modification system DNA methylase subunit